MQNELVISGKSTRIFRGLLADEMCLATSTRKNAHAMREEMHFEDQSAGVHESMDIPDIDPRSKAF